MQTETKKPIRPEIILLIIALFAAVLLIVMVVLCLPYFGQESEQLRAPLKTTQTEPTEETADATVEATEPLEPDQIPPPPNPYDRNDFQYVDNYLKLLHGDSLTAIDISAYQKEIDWQQVKQSGVEIAMIRVAYRGWGEKGIIKEDEYARENLKEAHEAGLTVGVYFFSQATSIEEVTEEVEFLLDIIKDHEITGHVVFDWEYVSEEARTADVDARTLTDCSLHFCELIEEAGYTPMVYFNAYQSSHLLHMSELKQYDFWLARYTDRMNFPYRLRMWQYTDSGRVPGIEGKVDINVFFPEQ